MIDKKILRSFFLFKRNNINLLTMKEKNSIIFNKLINNKNFIKAKKIGIYISYNNEVDTFNIIKYCFLNNKKIFVPKVFHDLMEFIEIFNIKDLEKINKWGILEPVNNKKIFFNLDLIITPIVCFDNYNNRIGYGKGYYDKYFSNFKGYKLGISFKEQKYFKKIPLDLNDIKLDLIITD